MTAQEQLQESINKQAIHRMELIIYCRDTLYNRVGGIKNLSYEDVANLINYEFSDINCKASELQLLEESNVSEEMLDRMLHYKIMTSKNG